MKAPTVKFYADRVTGGKMLYVFVMGILTILAADSKWPLEVTDLMTGSEKSVASSVVIPLVLAFGILAISSIWHRSFNRVLGEKSIQWTPEKLKIVVGMGLLHSTSAATCGLLFLKVVTQK